MAREIPLSSGRVAIVDDEDYGWLSAFNWHWGGVTAPYARRRPTNAEGGGKKTILMHRAVLIVPDGRFVDHINGDKLDNRRANLRLCSSAENLRNRGAPSNNTSGFKGVSFDRARGTWKAQIDVHGVKKARRARTPEAAARAYNELAKRFHGEFACLNVIDGAAT